METEPTTVETIPASEPAVVPETAPEVAPEATEGKIVTNQPVDVEKVEKVLTDVEKATLDEYHKDFVY